MNNHNTKSKKNNQSKFMNAVVNGTLSPVFFGNADPEIDLPDENGVTALMYACKKGDFKTASLLIQYGANVNYVNGKTFDTIEKGEKPLDIVLGSKDLTLEKVQVATLLIEKGATCNAKKFVVDLFLSTKTRKAKFLQLFLKRFESEMTLFFELTRGCKNIDHESMEDCIDEDFSVFP